MHFGRARGDCYFGQPWRLKLQLYKNGMCKKKSTTRFRFFFFQNSFAATTTGTGAVQFVPVQLQPQKTALLKPSNNENPIFESL